MSTNIRIEGNVITQAGVFALTSSLDPSYVGGNGLDVAGAQDVLARGNTVQATTGADVVVEGRLEIGDGHGLPRLVHLFGIESPGLTASLAIGDYVAGMAA